MEPEKDSDEGSEDQEGSKKRTRVKDDQSRKEEPKIQEELTKTFISYCELERIPVSKLEYRYPLLGKFKAFEWAIKALPAFGLSTAAGNEASASTLKRFN